MTSPRELSKLSRHELYDLIWSAPATMLAADFGISDVAIAKRCKRLSVPRPSRGYWAKLAAGGKPPKTPLPPTADEVFAQAARQRVGKVLSLPGNTAPLLPLASELMGALTKAKLDSYKRASVRETTLPEVSVSKKLAERVAQAFHVILNGVEPLGICFCKSRSSYDDGYFKRDQDRLYLSIEEDLVGPDGSRRRPPSWQWPRDNGAPSGYLTFTLKTGRYGAGNPKQWSESGKLPLEELLAKIVSAIRQHYLEVQELRAKEAIEQKKRMVEMERQYREWEKQEAIREQQEKERKHREALAAATKARREDLLKAAEWWRLSCALIEFVSECEKRWKNQAPELTAEQQGWLTWAKEIAGSLSPFAAGYPDPANDGAFDAIAVPHGGPYPATRNFCRPPAMPVIPPSSVPSTV